MIDDINLMISVPRNLKVEFSFKPNQLKTKGVGIFSLNGHIKAITKGLKWDFDE